MISHKEAYCVEAGSKLEVIVGPNQCCLPLGGVSISISGAKDAAEDLPHSAPLLFIDTFRRTGGSSILGHNIHFSAINEESRLLKISDREKGGEGNN